MRLSAGSDWVLRWLKQAVVVIEISIMVVVETEYLIKFATHFAETASMLHSLEIKNKGTGKSTCLDVVNRLYILSYSRTERQRQRQW